MAGVAATCFLPDDCGLVLRHVRSATGMVTSIGIPMGVGVIILTILITNIYVRRANSEFDTLNGEIISEANKP